jgi:ligand-binding sensor domain-containing protein/two-component sensor histidine kinase
MLKAAITVLAMLPGMFATCQEHAVEQIRDGERSIFSARRYSMAEGLPDRRITSIEQDHRGFIWLATAHGLVRFDGDEFVEYERLGAATDAVETVVRDKAGALWIHHADGELVIMDPAIGTVRSFVKYFNDTLPAWASDPITGIAAADDGTIILGQRGRLLRYRNGEGFRTIALELDHAVVPSIAGNNGDVWFTYSTGYMSMSSIPLHRISGDRFDDRDPVVEHIADVAVAPVQGHDRSPTRQPDLSGAYALQIMGDCWRCAWLMPGMDRSMPVRTGFNCLSKDEVAGNMRMHLSENIWLVNTTIRYMLPGADPVSAVVLFDLQQVHPQEGNQVNDALRDRAGNIWLATDFGLYKITMKRDRFQRFMHSASRDDRKGMRIRGMAVAGDRLFVNTDQVGHRVLDPHAGDILRRDDHPSFRGVMMSDGQGGVWRGEYGALIHENANGEILRRIEPQEGSTSVWSCLNTGANDMLIGTERGLFINGPNDTAMMVVHPDHPELDNSWIYHLARDRSNRILACTSTGLYSLDRQGGVLERWWSGADTGSDPSHHLPANDIRHFHEDPSGIFWLSTATRGLLRWDPITNGSRSLGRKEGLPAGSIHAVYADNKGVFWLSSDNGLARYDPVTGHVKIFTTADGTCCNEYNRISHTQGSDGWLYFGGMNGITAFDPEHFQYETATVSPSLVIKSILVLPGDSAGQHDLTREVVNGAPLRLRPSDRTLSIGMVLLSFDDPSRIRYAWRFEGAGQEWNIQREPYIHFTRLPYGEHLLTIRAHGSDGEWSKSELSIPIVMLTPVHLRWWFITLCVLSLAGSIHLGLRYRLRQMRQILAVRNRIALDLHDEVGSNLSSIVLFSTAVGERTEDLAPDAAAMLSRITQNSTKAMESMNDIVWSVNSRYDSLKDLVDRMRAYAQPICDTMNIELRFDIGHGTMEKKLGMEERKSLYLIFKEAVNNAVRHARCAHLAVSIQVARGALEMVITDDGLGMKDAQLSAVTLGGNGLGNMRRRAMETGGTVDISSGIGGGTTITFRSRQ